MQTHISKFDLSKLTKKEKLYFSMMAAKGAVPLIKGRPGEAKTAIIKSIAKKVGWRTDESKPFEYGMQLIDIRLSQIDEVVVTGYPAANPDGVTYSFRIPDWAKRANEKPTIIVFEEYNRAKLEQRNAAMQIMCEREVGMNWKLNDDVYMVATGNLGEEDGTDVEEIEAAQKGRMATIRHSLTIPEWEEGYATEHVHSLVLSFLKTNPQWFYKYENDESDSYASARTWDYLSKFIITNFGKTEPNLKEISDAMLMVGKAYVGNTITPFIRYIEQMQNVSVKDIINRYDQVKQHVAGFTRPQITEYLTNLSTFDIEKWNDQQLGNVVQFLKDIEDDDEKINFMIKIVDKLDIVKCKKDPESYKNTKFITNEFASLKTRIKSHHS